ncbi:MAG: EI24 domain-containing protein [Shimia sp.]|jgi:uncharacterized protein involved in cysteine biosynthesis|uniref:EI24 domain-containing protein n=1 Tax=Shimia sp. TaxID=1954381 RepID=UPI00405A2F09
MAIDVILGSFFAALGQMGDPRFRRVLLRGIGLTFALLVAAYAAFLQLMTWLTSSDMVQNTLGSITWVGDLLTWGSFFLMVFLSVFLMIPVASAITSMFLDEVAEAVEERKYPDVPRVPSVPFYEGLKDTVNFLGVLIAANIIALLIYAIVPPFALFIFWGMNGFLLGREYFTLAAMRHLGREGAKRLRKKHGATIWVAGILMAMPLSVPLVNLVIPIIGAATFTHLFHRLEPQLARATSG